MGKAQKPAPPVHCGNYIYYFEETGKEFPQALSYFLTEHPSLEVSAIAPDVARCRAGETRDLHEDSAYNCEYGATVGYTVVFRPQAT